MALEDAVLSLRTPWLCRKAISIWLSKVIRKRAYCAPPACRFSRRAIGDYIYHPSGIAADLRNAEMRSRTVEDWYRSLDWLYGHNPSLFSSAAPERSPKNHELNSARVPDIPVR